MHVGLSLRQVRAVEGNRPGHGRPDLQLERAGSGDVRGAGRKTARAVHERQVLGLGRAAGSNGIRKRDRRRRTIIDHSFGFRRGDGTGRGVDSLATGIDATADDHRGVDRRSKNAREREVERGETLLVRGARVHRGGRGYHRLDRDGRVPARGRRGQSARAYAHVVVDRRAVRAIRVARLVERVEIDRIDTFIVGIHRLLERARDGLGRQRGIRLRKGNVGNRKGPVERRNLHSRQETPVDDELARGTVFWTEVLQQRRLIQPRRGRAVVDHKRAGIDGVDRRVGGVTHARHRLEAIQPLLNVLRRHSGVGLIECDWKDIRLGTTAVLVVKLAVERVMARGVVPQGECDIDRQTVRRVGGIARRRHPARNRELLDRLIVEFQ